MVDLRLGGQRECQTNAMMQGNHSLEARRSQDKKRHALGEAPAVNCALWRRPQVFHDSHGFTAFRRGQERSQLHYRTID